MLDQLLKMIILAIVLTIMQTYIRTITRTIIFNNWSNNHLKYDQKHVVTSTEVLHHGWPVLEQHQWCSNTGHPWCKALVVFHNRGFSNRYTGDECLHWCLKSKFLCKTIIALDNIAKSPATFMVIKLYEPQQLVAKFSTSEKLTKKQDLTFLASTSAECSTNCFALSKSFLRQAICKTVSPLSLKIKIIISENVILYNWHSQIYYLVLVTRELKIRRRPNFSLYS